ncbi:unnamed protein product, partial [Mesorhabditis belari]|uniref:F-box domain-containing protein n=1 Tax=Mesorhabditis belari TaxID=2138241 RepID=A0AAF3JAK9_9BILA
MVNGCLLETDNYIRVWELVTSSLIDVLLYGTPCTGISFNETGEFLATCHQGEQAIYVWASKLHFVGRVPICALPIDYKPVWGQDRSKSLENANGSTLDLEALNRRFYFLFVEEDFEEAWKMLKLMESDGVEVKDLQGTETNEPYDFNELIEKANEYSNKDPPDVVEFSEKAWGAAGVQSVEVGDAWNEAQNSRSKFYDIVKLMVKEAREALLESIKGMAATIEQAGMADSNSSINPSFLQLPNEILVRIFENLDFRSLIKTTRAYGAQKNALPHSQTLFMNGQRVDEDYLISKESESSDVHRVYSTDPSISVAFRAKKYLHQQIDYFSAKGINLDDLLGKFFPKFEPVFTWQPAIKHFELNEVTFGSTLVFWEWKDVLEFFSPIISFKLVNVTANCNGRSDKVIKKDLLMCLEKHQIPRVHLNRLNFDFETKDNTELKYNLPIEYYEKGIFVIDTDSLLNELERWYLGKRKIEYWRIDVSSERAWKHLKEWINQKGTHIKKTQLGFVVTGAVKNQANQCSLKMTKKILVNGLEVSVKEEEYGELAGLFKDDVQVEDDLEGYQSTLTHEQYDFNHFIEKLEEYSNKNPPDVDQFSEKLWGAAAICVTECFLNGPQAFKLTKAWEGAQNSHSNFYDMSPWKKDKREELLKQLALETIDLNKDPYFMRNHVGTYECKLCLTLHNNEGSYLAHTQGKKHQANLARRAAKEAAEQPFLPAPQQAKVDIKRFVKIGRPEMSSMEVDKSTTFSCHNLKEIQDILGYDNFAPIIEQGLGTLDFFKLLHTLCTEIKVLDELQESPSAIQSLDEAKAFLYELSAFLTELDCGISDLLSGSLEERFSSTTRRYALIDFLINELKVARVLADEKLKAPVKAGY